MPRGQKRLARTFSTDKRLDAGDITQTDGLTAFTCFIWAYRTTAALSSKMAFKIQNAAGEGGFQFPISHLDSTKWGIDIHDNNATKRLLTYNTTTNISNDSWHAHFGAWGGGNNSLLYYDTIAQTSGNVVASTPVTMQASDDNFSIGATPVGANPYTGNLANYAMWSVDIGAIMAVALAHGVNPFVIRNDVLILYYSIAGNNDPEPQYKNGIGNATLEGTANPPKFAGNPPVEHLSCYISGYC